MAKSAEQCRARLGFEVTTSTGQGGRYLASKRGLLPFSEKMMIMPGLMSTAFLARAQHTAWCNDGTDIGTGNKGCEHSMRAYFRKLFLAKKAAR